MDSLPTYQEATSKRQPWYSRLVGRLFRRTRSPPQPGMLVDRKLLADYPQDDASPSSSKPSKGKHSPQFDIARPAHYRNSMIHTNDQPPTNYIRIKRNNAPITGIWNIDTSLQVPAHLLVSFKDKNEARHHLHLWSVTQPIDAVANVVGEGKELALITCSTLSKVNLRVSKPPNRAVSIFCRGSTISVRIPRTYCGSVKCHSLSGTVHFSAEIAKQISTIYEKGRESRHFIGELPSSIKSQDGEEVEGENPNHDVMKLKAKSRVGEKYGEVFIAYEDEPPMPIISVKSWV